jgi:hypothetical protein
VAREQELFLSVSDLSSEERLINDIGFAKIAA